MSQRDGVIRFETRHSLAKLEPRLLPVANALEVWRARLFEQGLIGQDGVRYAGAAWGNVSARVSEATFLITGSQTGRLPHADAERHYALVEGCDWSMAAGVVTSRGPIVPSSEAMTHAALYRALPAVNAVFHVHSPELFHAPALAQTPATVEYGTPAMAEAVRAVALAGARVVVMRGHQDGVLAFGASDEEAGAELLRALRAALPGLARDRI